MAYFPFFVDLDGKKGLIAGGGHIALRKVRALLPFGPALTVAAPQILPELRQMNEIRCQTVCFTPELLHEMDFVIAATDDAALNREIAAVCKAHRIPVNAVDDRDACSFLFPALIREGALTIGISTGGASPSAARWLKEQIAACIPDNFDGLLAYLASCREPVKAAISDSNARAACFASLLAACLTDGWPLSEDALRHTIETAVAVPARKPGTVYLVGAGCGAADLITLRGLRCLKCCDTVIYDELIDPALLDFAPAAATRICMGKRAGRHLATQAEICAALIAHARRGETVVRLKGGDPFVFGRGGEEILALRAAGIPCEEVPGISSAIGIPAEAGIPVTHRGLSQSVHIVTAHTADTADGLPENLSALAKTGGTLIFLMGLGHLRPLSEKLLAFGMDPQTPAAVLSGGNSPAPAVVRGTLGNIAGQTETAGVCPPAVIVIGAVAALHLFA